MNGNFKSGLLIRGFRGIQNLHLKRVGNVNLFVGRNSVGKTSVLEALKLYSSGGVPWVLAEILQSRDERDRDARDASRRGVTLPEISSLFFGRPDFLQRGVFAEIQAGPSESPTSYSVAWLKRHRDPDGSIRYSSEQLELYEDSEDHRPFLRVSQNGDLKAHFRLDGAYTSPFRTEETSLSEPNAYSFVGSQGLDASELGRLWDRITLTEWEEALHEALSVFDKRIQRISLVETESRSPRRAIVKLQGVIRPVPLRSLGEGVSRFLGIALALANAKNGYLLVDEFDNGLHYSIQEHLWKFVLRSARQLGVQVFATTHSRDCVAAFGEASDRDTQSEGVLSRLEEVRGGIGATQFAEGEIIAATRELVEVR